MEYLSTEQEVRKVLAMPAKKYKKGIFFAVSVLLLLTAVLTSYLLCRWLGEPYFNSWISSAGEAVVAGSLLALQGTFIKQISTLIKEADLDLVPKKMTFCANLSCVGVIFLVQCGDVALHIIVQIVETKTNVDTTHSTTFLILALTVQVLLICAYFSFFLLVLRTTKGAHTFEDLILH